MPIYMEAVLQLTAEGFSHTGESVTGRVMKVLPNGPYRIQSDREARGTNMPSQNFDTVQDARAALLTYWNQCELSHVAAGKPNWKQYL